MNATDTVPAHLEGILEAVEGHYQGLNTLNSLSFKTVYGWYLEAHECGRAGSEGARELASLLCSAILDGCYRRNS